MLEDLLFEYENKDEKKKIHTRKKKIQKDHASRKSLMIILEASLKKKDETQK